MDEHRIGLKPILRGIWAPKGERPIALSHHRYEWLYVWGFVEPVTGAVVQAFTTGTVVQVFQLVGSVLTETWSGSKLDGPS